MRHLGRLLTWLPSSSSTISVRIRNDLCVIGNARNLQQLQPCLSVSTHLLHRLCSTQTAAAVSADAVGPAANTHEFPLERIRNFSIIAHVDHGKSTLADRILEMVGAIQPLGEGGVKNQQVLDKLQVEKERGITVKSQTVSFYYEKDGLTYQMNLIDTPGHADFNYEVSRSLAACEGCILLVDANSGIQAQTVNNFFLAFERELAVIPVMNKIDLPHARPEVIADQLVKVFDVVRDDIIRISAKNGLNIKAVVDAIVERVPPPSGSTTEPFKALIFDSWFRQFKGVVSLITLKSGSLRVGDKVQGYHSKKLHTVQQIGVFTPNEKPVDVLHAGQVGYVMSTMKDPADAPIGDTVFKPEDGGIIEPFEGFKKMAPVVFAGFYPVDASNPAPFEKCIRALTLNDPSVDVQKDTSTLGNGYRLGFLGLLHLDVFRLRLTQEYESSNALVTAPTVKYKIIKKGSAVEEFIHDPKVIPNIDDCESMEEPMVLATIMTPKEFEPAIRSLTMERRAVERERMDIDESRLIIKYRIPLNEIILDFHETLKSISSGFAAYEYEEDGYEPTHVVRLDFTVNGHLVEELSIMVHNERARAIATFVVGRLKRVIVPQPFKIKIKGQVGEGNWPKILASDNKGALKGKDTSSLSMAAKNKAKKAANSKARLAGEVVVPNDAFIQVLKGS